MQVFRDNSGIEKPGSMRLWRGSLVLAALLLLGLPMADSAVKHTAKASASKKAGARKGSRLSKAARAAKSAKLKQAFVVSTELRPMAQQLAATRTAAAYAGVAAYARQHQGEAAMAAYLALGHAYLLDNRNAEAAQSLRQARVVGDALADYAEFLERRRKHAAGNEAAAEELLKGFADRNPDSIFALQAPEVEAQVLLGMNNASGRGRCWRRILTRRIEWGTSWRWGR